VRAGDEVGESLEILLLIALPLAWGLATEYVFERLRRRRRPSTIEDSRDE
jgi:hypothetical protein